MTSGARVPRETMAVVLAGGKGARLGPLTVIGPARQTGAMGPSVEPVVITGDDIRPERIYACA